LSNRILARGFVPPDFNELESPTDSGFVNYDLKGCFLVITWYRMESGLFEIVSYIS
jgi:hypothetical protein